MPDDSLATLSEEYGHAGRVTLPDVRGGHAGRVTLPDVHGGHAGRVTLPMVALIQQFKSYLVRTYAIRFQRDFFDTRLRDDAHFAEKYEYVLGNPVRKGLCATPSDWPYSIAFSQIDGERHENQLFSEREHV